MKVTITKSDEQIEYWENCAVNFLPTWLSINFNNQEGLTSRTFVYPISEIKQVEVEYDVIGD